MPLWHAIGSVFELMTPRQYATMTLSQWHAITAIGIACPACPIGTIGTACPACPASTIGTACPVPHARIARPAPTTVVGCVIYFLL